MTDYRPDVRYPELGEGFADVVAPAKFAEVTLRFRNDRAAAEVGLDHLDDAQWRAAFARFDPLPDNLPAPLALRYHGHQFRNYNPNIGDGRGFLLAQLRDGHGRLLDLGTKGSGRTPYSRSGDGRLTLKGGVRELLATEMLAARGVNTSQTFSLIETHEDLHRGDEPSPSRSCVMVRLSHSHVRFGTFQRHAYEKRPDRLRALVEHCREHYFAETLADCTAAALPTEFLREVCRRSARLAAEWMAAGFVHGVLNTDNLVVTGESFDYGPWRFLPEYDESFTAAYFDHSGLYAYGRQPGAVLWNLTRLAEALRSVIDPRAAEPVMREFKPTFEAALAERVVARLGVVPVDADTDRQLADLSMEHLRVSSMRFDDFFFDLYGGGAAVARAVEGPRGAVYETPAARALREHLEGREPAQPGGEPNDQGMLIDRVEAIWDAIAEDDDWQPLYDAVEAIRSSAEP